MTGSKKNYLLDMDGVLVHGKRPLPGASEFIQRLIDSKVEFLIVTNNPIFTPNDLAHRLQLSGLKVPTERIFTSALATARFMKTQKPGGTAYVVGESGLTSAIHETGYVITDTAPDYVVLGDTTIYNFEQITTATRLIAAGSSFIATNPDASGPAEAGLVPACGAMAALIEKASGRSPLFIGKPNPLMMRLALNYLGVHSENTVMVGDNMETDIIAGVQTGMETILVLSGVTEREDVGRFPYQPTHIFNDVSDIEI